MHRLTMSMFVHFADTTCMNLVEDPNDNFADLRDKNDMRMLIDAGAFKGLKAPVADEFVDMARQKYKLTKVSRERERLGL